MVSKLKASRRTPSSAQAGRTWPSRGHRVSGVGGLALGVLLVWSLVWGAWHRTWHHPTEFGVWHRPVGQAQAADTAQGRDSSPEHSALEALGHVAGGDDCRLIDQLLLGDSHCAPMNLPLATPRLAEALIAAPEANPGIASPLSYRARAPPPLAA